MKATELLQKQHREIEELLARLADAGAEEQRSVRAELASLLVAHSAIEEEIFYPALREAAPELVLEAIEEHGLAEYELAKSFGGRQGEERARARAVVLADVLRAHIRKEETVIFRKADAEITNQELAEIGEIMAARFEHVRRGDVMRLLARAIVENAPRLPVRKAKPARRVAGKPARRGATAKRGVAKRGASQRSGTQRSGTQRSGTQRSGTQRSGTQRSGQKRGGTQRSAVKGQTSKRTGAQKSAGQKSKRSQSRAARS